MPTYKYKSELYNVETFENRKSTTKHIESMKSGVKNHNADINY